VTRAAAPSILPVLGGFTARTGRDSAPTTLAGAKIDRPTEAISVAAWFTESAISIWHLADANREATNVSRVPMRQSPPRRVSSSLLKRSSKNTDSV
jgi:hypothetical protein